MRSGGFSIYFELIKHNDILPTSFNHPIYIYAVVSTIIAYYGAEFWHLMNVHIPIHSCQIKMDTDMNITNL